MTHAGSTHTIVTGAGSGIGACIATALAQQGHKLSLLGRRSQPLENTADSIGTDNCQVITCDVADAHAVETAFAEARSGFGAIDVLINCAGMAPTAPFHKLEPSEWQRVIDTNLNGVFNCTSAVIEEMRERNSGRIINIASTAALKGYAYVSAYCAAKHGVLGLTRALALETAKLGITVNAICPGYTDTDIIRDSVTQIVEKTGRSEEQALAQFTDTNPQGRLIQPEEIASTVLWLCSDAARSVTGQALSISGGETT